MFQTLQAGSSWEIPFVVGSTGGRLLQSGTGVSVEVSKKEIRYKSGEISENSIVLVDSTQPSSYFDEVLGKLILTPSSDTA